MSNPSKARGTKWEVAVAAWLNDALPTTVERRALGGTKDRGDIAGIEGVVIEAKACKAMELGAWMKEAEIEADRDGGSLAIVAHKRRGKTSVGDAYFSMPGWVFLELLKGWQRSEGITTAFAPKGFTGTWS